ncbi:MAG: hypothetical protein WDM92_10575 [Caulobacteraceae bacterium]
MSRPARETEFIESAIASTGRLTDGLERSLAAVRPLVPISPAGVARMSPAEADAVDLLLKRFETAFEAGRRLFRAALLVWDEPQDGLTFIDLLNRAEKIGVLQSANLWRDIGRTRNSVVHEYAMNPDDAAVAINAAHAHAGAALELLRQALAAIAQRYPAEPSS